MQRDLSTWFPLSNICTGFTPSSCSMFPLSPPPHSPATPQLSVCVCQCALQISVKPQGVWQVMPLLAFSALRLSPFISFSTSSLKRCLRAASFQWVNVSGSIKREDNKAVWSREGQHLFKWDLKEEEEQGEEEGEDRWGWCWLLFSRSVAHSLPQRDKLSYCVSLFAVTDAISSRRSRIDSVPAWYDGGGSPRRGGREKKRRKA